MRGKTQYPESRGTRTNAGLHTENIHGKVTGMFTDDTKRQKALVYINEDSQDIHNT